MRLPHHDVLIPILLVVVVFPAVAGSWWNFSGYATRTFADPVEMSSIAPARGALLQETQPASGGLAQEPDFLSTDSCPLK